MASVAPELPALARDRAFETLYRRYVKDVYHYSLALLRNPADAEDVTQTTFMNAYRAFKRGEEIHKPQHWLIKIAHNVARSRYARATRRVKEVPLDDHITQLAIPESEKPDVHAVLDALGRLPLNQRAALVMRELEGRTYAEIADTIGVSVPAVETLIFRARRSMRLKASAVRVLGVVPLPTSLAQLFDAGTVVAGGGAFAGVGFLVKAAIAIVAGAVATEIGTGGLHRAAPATPRPVAQLSRSAALGRLTALRLVPVSIRVRPAGTGGAAVETAGPGVPPGVTATQAGSPSAQGAGAAPSTPQVALPSKATATTASSAVAAASSAVGTVAGTVSTVTGTLPPLPVAPPSVPGPVPSPPPVKPPVLP